MGHLGRPKEGRDSKLSLAVCGKELEKLLNQKVIFSDDCIGEHTEKLAKNLKPGEILLLENLRFYSAEENLKKIQHLHKNLARLVDVLY